MKENKYYSFRKKHPMWHMANALLSMFLPFGLVALTTVILEPAEGCAVLAIYAMVGSLVLGGGLLLCVATDYDKEVFLRLNVYPIAIGTLITVGNLFCACSESISSNFDRGVLQYQLVCYLSVFWFSLLYSLAREAIMDCISRKTRLNENQIDKRTEGFFNHCWYRKIHKEYGIGWIYYFNAILTTAIVLFLIGTTVLVFHKNIAKFVMPLSLFTSLGMAFLAVFALINGIKNKKSYFCSNKKRLLGRIPYFYDLAEIASVFALVWWQIKCYIAI